MTVGQTSDAITTSVTVAPQPTAITVAGGRVLVTSANLDANFVPIGNGIVTAIDPKTMQVLGTATMGGTNSSDAAVGPGRPAVRRQHRRLRRPGQPHDRESGDDDGRRRPFPTWASGRARSASMRAALAYISGFFSGTLVWNTKTRTFVRGADNPVCAKLGNGNCRGAFAAATNVGRRPLSGLLRQHVAGAIRLRVQGGRLHAQRQHRGRGLDPLRSSFEHSEHDAARPL